MIFAQSTVAYAGNSSDGEMEAGPSQGPDQSALHMGFNTSFIHISCGGLNMNDSYKLTCLNAWSPAGGTVDKD